MESVAAPAIQIHHDSVGIADDVDDDGKECRRTVGRQFIIRNSCSVSRPRPLSVGRGNRVPDRISFPSECVLRPELVMGKIFIVAALSITSEPVSVA